MFVDCLFRISDDGWLLVALEAVVNVDMGFDME